MIFLLLSIVCSVAVSVLLKLARRQGMLVTQMVAVNYPVAAACCVYFLRPDMGQWQSYLPAWPLFLALGLLLPTVFVMMGRAVDAAGIAKADAAQRLALFLPVMAAFVLFGEVLTSNKLIGLLLAVPALLALLYRPAGGKHGGVHAAGYLLAVWAGYGIIDILFKRLSASGQALAPTLLLAFVLAGVLIWAYLLWRRTSWNRASMVGGLLLGLLNFANILFYIRAHQAYGSNPTLVFAGMNLGVIVLGTLIGGLLFREKIHAVNAAGIALALMAIICLFYLAPLQAWLGW